MSGWLATFGWGMLAGYSWAQIADIRKTWREAKAKVNETRRQYGLPEEKRWWRM